MTDKVLQTAILQKLARILVSKGLMLATAESCTGGLIAGAFTDLAGSSSFFNGGVVSYANHVKEGVLNVQHTTLQDHGAVSSQVAEEMAIGAQKALSAAISVSTTGIAGPGGGSPDKPVGTVWFGFALKDRVFSEKKVFYGSRHAVRTQALFFALERLLKELQD